MWIMFTVTPVFLVSNVSTLATWIPSQYQVLLLNLFTKTVAKN